jgi:hypothetical protein
MLLNEETLLQYWEQQEPIDTSDVVDRLKKLE